MTSWMPIFWQLYWFVENRKVGTRERRSCFGVKGTGWSMLCLCWSSSNNPVVLTRSGRSESLIGQHLRLLVDAIGVCRRKQQQTKGRQSTSNQFMHDRRCQYCLALRPIINGDHGTCYIAAWSGSETKSPRFQLWSFSSLVQFEATLNESNHEQNFNNNNQYHHIWIGYVLHSTDKNLFDLSCFYSFVFTSHIIYFPWMLTEIIIINSMKII